MMPVSDRWSEGRGEGKVEEWQCYNVSKRGLMRNLYVVLLG